MCSEILSRYMFQGKWPLTQGQIHDSKEIQVVSSFLLFLLLQEDQWVLAMDSLWAVFIQWLICLTSLNNNKSHVQAQCIVIQQHWLDAGQLPGTECIPTSFCDQIYSVCKAFTFLQNLPPFQSTSGNSGSLSRDKNEELGLVEVTFPFIFYIFSLYILQQVCA